MRGPGFNHPGCYQSPCNNIKKESLCNRAGNDFYDCKWCGKRNGISYGCQNGRSESFAQCSNIGNLPGVCSECTPKKKKYDRKYAKLHATCEDQVCKETCCASPYCTCESVRDLGNDGTGLDILTG